MLEQITNWANNNQGLVAIIVPVFILFVTMIVYLVSYLIKRFLFNDRAGKNLIQKQKGGDNSENYQAGRDINIPK